MKKTIYGWTIKNWNMIMRRTNMQDFDYVIHDEIYRDKFALARTKVKITIEEVKNEYAKKKV